MWTWWVGTAQQSAGEPIWAGDPGPLVDGKVGCVQDGAPTASLAEDLEGQICLEVWPETPILPKSAFS